MKQHLRSLVVLSAFAALGFLLGCAKQGTTEQQPVVETKWKEGYGGDFVSKDIRNRIESTCISAQRLRSLNLNEALGVKEKSRNIADEVCELTKEAALKIEPVDELYLDQEKKRPRDLRSFPDEKPKRLEANKSSWRTPNISMADRKEMIDHEIMRLLGIPDDDYSNSKLFRASLDASEDQHSMMTTCNGPEIHAQLAGIPSIRLPEVMTQIGQQQCAVGLPILKTLDLEAWGKDLGEKAFTGFGTGLIAGMILDPTQSETGPAFSILKALGEVRPNALAALNVEFCKYVDHGARSLPCGSIVDVLVGGDSRVRRSLDRTEERNSYEPNVIRVLNMLAKANPTFFARQFFEETPSGKLLRIGLLKSAIQAQNWQILSWMGRMQAEASANDNRTISMSGIVGSINFAEVEQDAKSASSRVGFDGEGLLGLATCSAEYIHFNAQLAFSSSPDAPVRPFSCETKNR